MLFAYFVYIAQLTKFRRGSSLLMEKFLLTEKTKAEERPWYKKREKKTGPKTKDFEQSRVKPKFVIHRAKMRFPFIYASTSLDTWTLTIASKCYFESRLSILFLASQHILRFFHFCHGFFLWRWQLCPLLCRPPQRSTERSRWKNVSAKDHFSREILIHRLDARRSRCPIGLRFREAR